MVHGYPLGGSKPVAQQNRAQHIIGAWDLDMIEPAPSKRITYHMQTNHSRARDDARPLRWRLRQSNQQQLRPIHLKPNATAKPRLAPLSVKPSIAAQSKPERPNSEFSPLIQEFLDECGYTDR